jgi:hypothetical protein
MDKPNIQIGDEVREMTNEEYAEYLKTVKELTVPTVQQVEINRLYAYEQTSDPLYFKWQRGDATEAEWREAVAKVKLDNPYPPAP